MYSRHIRKIIYVVVRVVVCSEKKGKDIKSERVSSPSASENEYSNYKKTSALPNHAHQVEQLNGNQETTSSSPPVLSMFAPKSRETAKRLVHKGFYHVVGRLKHVCI